MLFYDAKDIISGSYYHLGDITVKLCNYFNDGYGKSDAYKKLVKKGILVRTELDYLFEHVVYNTDGTINRIVRSTDEQINKSLRYLTDLTGVKNTAAVPVFRKIYVLRTPPTTSGVGSVTNGIVYQGLWSGASNAIPSGTILALYMWRASSATTSLLGPDGGIIAAGSLILALVDSPGSSLADTTKWAIIPATGI